MKKIKKFLSNNLVERAIKSFVEGFLTYLYLQLQAGNIEYSKTFLMSLLAGGICAGLSALINYLLSLLKNDYKVEKVKIKEVK